MKPVYTITFCDHIKNVKQILRKYDRVNWPLSRYVYTTIIPIFASLFYSSKDTKKVEKKEDSCGAIK